MADLSTNELMRCPICKHIAIKLVPVKDNGKGIKTCLKCKAKRIEKGDKNAK